MQNSEHFPKLLDTDIFRKLPMDFRRNFLDSCSRKTFEEPSVVLMQGEPSPGMYLVAKGAADIVFLGSDGERTYLGRGIPGSTFGEIESISGEDCAGTCEATEDSILLFCPNTQLRKHLETFQFLSNIMATVHQRMLHWNYFRSVDLHAPAYERIWAYLLLLMDENGEISGSQSFLAEVTGCSRQTINRELGVMRERGKISVDSRVITVLEHKKLERAPHI